MNKYRILWTSYVGKTEVCIVLLARDAVAMRRNVGRMNMRNNNGYFRYLGPAL